MSVEFSALQGKTKEKLKSLLKWRKPMHRHNVVKIVC